MPLLRAVATALVLLSLSFEAAGQGVASPVPRASASFAAAGGEDVTETRPAVPRPLIHAFETGDREALGALSDLARIPLEAIEGLDVTDADRAGAAGIGPTFDRVYLDAVVAMHDEARGQVQLVRLLRRADGWVAVFRFWASGSGDRLALTYVEAMVSTEGRLVDLYFHWDGTRVSERLRLAIYALIAERDPGPLAGMLGVQRLSRDDARRWLEALVLAPSGAGAAVAEAMDGMEASNRVTRQWMLERLRVANVLGDRATARATMAHLEARFADDPGLQALYWHYAGLRDDHADELVHFMAFRRTITPDPRLDQLACRVAVRAERWTDGVVSCAHATVGLPDESEGWNGLVFSTGQAADARAFIDAVEGYERRFERRLDVQAMAEGESMDALIADPVFQAWMDTRR